MPDTGIVLSTIMAVFVMGALIGSVGVGGLLLAPWLVRVGGLSIHEAIVSSMAAFIATGLVAVWLFWRGDAHIGARWPAIAATIPGALIGSIALAAIPGSAAAMVLATFLVATGARMLLAKPGTPDRDQRSTATADGVTGLVTGFFSALTGTGGPMVMVPLLVWRGIPLLTAIALGQVVQLPVASVATLANLTAGNVNLLLAAGLAVPLVAGVVCGRRWVRMLPIASLTSVVAILLIGTGIWFALAEL